MKHISLTVLKYSDQSLLVLLNNAQNSKKMSRGQLCRTGYILQIVQSFDQKKILPSLNINNLFLFLYLLLLRWTARQRNVLHSAECMWKELLP